MCIFIKSVVPQKEMHGFSDLSPGKPETNHYIRVRKSFQEILQGIIDQPAVCFSRVFLLIRIR